LATDLEDIRDDDESSDGYEEAIEALQNIVDSLGAAADKSNKTTLRSFNLINSLVELIDEPTLEDPTSPRS